MYKLLLASAAVCLLAATAVAQASYYIPSNTPTTGTCNMTPFGLGSATPSSTWSNQKYQCMATQAQLGNSQVLEICDIAWAPCSTGIKHFDTIEVVLAQTSAATLSTTFSANLVQNVQTVLKCKDYDWYRNAGKWDRIGLQKNYLYIAGNYPNLVIQITVTGAHGLTTFGNGNHRTNAQQRVYHFGWTLAAGPNAAGSTDQVALKFEVVSKRNDLHRFGQGCKGSAGVPALTFAGSAAPGQSLGISVANCVANAPVLHVFGASTFNPGLDLGFLGASGCTLYPTVDIVLGGAADSSGQYDFKVQVPQNTPPSLILYTQVFPADSSANNWGRSASNYGRILSGAL